jgi:cytochrome bd-type quinol oxidase subunit 1
MELTINVPALLFPGITLLMLAYTNRFLGLASLIRNLHDKLRENKERPSIVKQIRNLRLRLYLIRYMQLFGAFSFALCLVCMFCIYQNKKEAAELTFFISLFSLFLSLLISLWEIQISTRALDYELSDMEDSK